ncbi:hypothetical protein ES705_10504 [subsurface metagenome]
MAKSKSPDKRDWQPREQRLVSEFVARFYGDYESRTHVHLGSTPPRLKGKFITDEDARLVGVFRRWADAIVFMPDRLILIEGKILPQPGVLSQLKLYEELIPKTPELSEHRGKPIEKIIVCAIEDPLITELARREGVGVRIYRPSWINSYMKKLHPWEKTPGIGTLD